MHYTSGSLGLGGVSNRTTFFTPLLNRNNTLNNIMNLAINLYSKVRGYSTKRRGNNNLQLFIFYPSS